MSVAQVNFRYKLISILIVGCFVSPPHAFSAEVQAQTECSGNAESIATVAGGLLGAFVGHQIGDGKAGAVVVGAALGGWLGNYIGSEIDRRHCELEKIAKANGVDVKTDQVELKDGASNASTTDTISPTAGKNVDMPISTGKVDIVRLPGVGHFASGSAALTEKSKSYFSEMAQQYAAEKASDGAIKALEQKSAQQGMQLSDADKAKNHKQLTDDFNQRPIVLVGHTDDTGDSLANQQLSEQRAHVVANLFKSKGIPASRIYFRGAGDVDPVADNRTEEGRAANRRVEIIELESREKLDTFIALKKSNLDYLRPKGESVAGAASLSTPETSTGASAADSVEKPRRTKITKASAAQNSHASVDALQQDNVTAKPTAAANDATIEYAGSSSTPMQKSSVDFGGTPASGKIAPEVSKSMGKAMQQEKGLMASFGGFFVKEAQATDEKIYNLPCTADAPRFGGQYLSLETGKATATTKTSDYAPGLYQTSWVGVVNGNYLGITPVGVLRSNFQPASLPKLLVYANTDSPGTSVKPTLTIPMHVNVYPGEKGILYRMYSTNKVSLVCMDIVFPRHAPFTSPAGKLYSKRSGQTFESDYVPSMLATNNK